ncbi:MAG: sugar transferase [candidate division WOR-3 bacterium]
MKRLILRNRRFLFILFMIVCDALLIMSAFFLAYTIRYFYSPPGIVPLENYLRFVAILIPGWIGIVAYFGLYQIRRGWRYSELFFSTVLAVSLGIVVFLFMSYILKQFFYSRLLLIYAWVLGILFLSGLRVFLKRLIIFFRNRGIGVKRILIIGESNAAQLIQKVVRVHPELGYKIVGTISPMTAGETVDEKENAHTGKDIKVAETSLIIDEIINLKINEVIFTIPLGRSNDLWAVANACQRHGIEIRVVPDIYEILSCRMWINDIAGIPTIYFRPINLQFWEKLGKILLDYIGSIILLILTLPLTILIYLKLKMSFKGPVLKSEVRIGEREKRFSMYRFFVPVTIEKINPHITAVPTPFGNFIEKYGLTEIPQLLNILKGDMSLVGPRPENLLRYDRYNERQKRRFLVKPGLTGLAQINMMRGFSSYEERIFFDLEYVEQQSLFLDLKILLQTSWLILGRVCRRLPVGKLVYLDQKTAL